MNPMLQRHCAKFIYIVPDGLRELMSDISREVIRSQPQEVYTFIADYLDALMITRENARIAARLVENITEIAETTVELLLRIGMTREEADRVVTVIQRYFREFLERKKRDQHYTEVEGEFDEMQDFTQRILAELEIDYSKLEEVAIIIQNAYRKFKERQKREHDLLFGMVDWRIAARSAIALYKRTGVTHYEANRAATLIKAAYKGYYTRRIMRRLLKQGLDESFVEEEETAETIEESQVMLTEWRKYGIAKATIPEFTFSLEESIGEHFYLGREVLSEADEISQPTEAIYETGERTDDYQMTLDAEQVPFMEEDQTYFGEQSPEQTELEGEDVTEVPMSSVGDEMTTGPEGTIVTDTPRTDVTEVTENVTADVETSVAVTTEE